MEEVVVYVWEGFFEVYLLIGVGLLLWGGVGGVGGVGREGGDTC